MMKILWLLGLLVAGAAARPEANPSGDPGDDDSRPFIPSDTINIDGIGVSRCRQVGDMYFAHSWGGCHICSCFPSAYSGGIYAKCAPCRGCHNEPAPVPVPAPIPFPVPTPIPFPVPLPDPDPTPVIPGPYLTTWPAPEPELRHMLVPESEAVVPSCPPPVYIPGPPRPYPVPVPVPGRKIYIRVPVSVPSQPEKIYVQGPSVPAPYPVEHRVPFPVAVDRPYPVPSPPKIVTISVPELVPGPEVRIPVPVPVPSPPVRIPYPVTKYVKVPGADKLIPVPVPVQVDNPKYYPVPVVYYVSPICRNKVPLQPFSVPGDPCHVNVCKIQYNYVYVETRTLPYCNEPSYGPVSHIDPSFGPFPNNEPYGPLIRPSPLISNSGAIANAVSNAMSNGGGTATSNAEPNAISGSGGLEPFGPGPFGPGQFGPESIGSGLYGPRSLGPESIGSGPFGPGSFGPESIGSGTFGPGPFGPESIGSGSFGPGSLGPASVGTEPFGHSNWPSDWPYAGGIRGDAEANAIANAVSNGGGSPGGLFPGEYSGGFSKGFEVLPGNGGFGEEGDLQFGGGSDGSYLGSFTPGGYSGDFPGGYGGLPGYGDFGGDAEANAIANAVNSGGANPGGLFPGEYPGKLPGGFGGLQSYGGFGDGELNIGDGSAGSYPGNVIPGGYSGGFPGELDGFGGGAEGNALANVVSMGGGNAYSNAEANALSGSYGGQGGLGGLVGLGGISGLGGLGGLGGFSGLGGFGGGAEANAVANAVNNGGGNAHASADDHPVSGGFGGSLQLKMNNDNAQKQDSPVAGSSGTRRINFKRPRRIYSSSEDDGDDEDAYTPPSPKRACTVNGISDQRLDYLQKQIVCGRRSNVIEHRRDSALSAVKDKYNKAILRRIPPSTEYLFQPKEFSDAVAKSGGGSKVFRRPYLPAEGSQVMQGNNRPYLPAEGNQVAPRRSTDPEVSFRAYNRNKYQQAPASGKDKSLTGKPNYSAANNKSSQRPRDNFRGHRKQ